MKERNGNPFDIVKATDLSDAQIEDYFVDFPSGASLVERIKPASGMPMIIFGGKGSGKTHLMRYLSYPLTARRGTGVTPAQRIASAGHLGIYFRCGGLNAQRFAGKGQTQDVWEALFAYYMELWLAQLVLASIFEIYESEESLNDPALIENLLVLVDHEHATALESLKQFRDYLFDLQRAVDVAVNNAALTRRLDVNIVVTRGRLIFGLPKLLSRHLPELSEILFVYLIDEFENLTESQQQYINTLLRERESPCTFKVGVRLYGLKTRKTLSAGEEIRENAEFEALRLDEELRRRPEKAQFRFAERLVQRRLASEETYKAQKSIELWFQGDQNVTDNIRVALGQQDQSADGARPYFKRLRALLLRRADHRVDQVVTPNEWVANICASLAYPQDPLIERTNVFMFYRLWSRGKNLDQAALEIRRYIEGTEESPSLGAQRRVLAHFKSDILAQLLREMRMPQRYVGFRSFVQMSAGLPRALLTILKHIYKWSQFLGEEPFEAGQISLKAQSEGVREAAEWFFMESRSPGPDGLLVRGAITRLGELLREIRFSDKPSECSPCTFSTNLTACSDRGRHVLETAEAWSMLIRIAGGQSDRNTGRVDVKYQIHPMIAPRFDLPIARRGALALSGPEVDSIFAPEDSNDFRRIQNKRVHMMTAPFETSTSTARVNQGDLF